MESHLFLNSLDDSLLRLLPALITTDKHGPGSHEQELETRMERIVNSSMEKANNMVFRGRAQKGLLFCLDDAGEQLVIRHKYGWVTDIQGFRRLAPGVFEGVVGEVYRKGEIIVAHRREANGQYRWDRDTYVPRGGNEGPPPYNAIVCVPIIGTSHSSTEDNRLGVLCFDSADVDLFDPPEIKETLEKFARHLATSLQIYSKLSQACSASSCIYVRARPVA